MRSVFRDNETSWTVFWFEGGADDASSICIDFKYNPWFNAWLCKVSYSRTRTIFDVNLEPEW